MNVVPFLCLMAVFLPATFLVYNHKTVIGAGGGLLGPSSGAIKEVVQH